MDDKNDSLKKALIFGAGSIALYYMLFKYADVTVQWAMLIRDGHKGYFLSAIIIPFIFSLVHGAFTGYFWDAIGLKPAHQGKK